MTLAVYAAAGADPARLVYASPGAPTGATLGKPATLSSSLAAWLELEFAGQTRQVPARLAPTVVE